MKPDRSLRELEEERAVPWREPGVFAWHRARYAFATPAVAGRAVLDIGCGEGYGAALLADRARSVLGVDYSPAAIRHAQASYRRDNLRFEVAEATALGPELGRFDVVTCFEVVEHLDRPEALLDGIARVLRPRGVVFLSTPNAVVDRLFEVVGGHERYPYHVGLLEPKALRRLVRARFDRVVLYGQSVKGNALHAALKALDVANLRHRVVRSASLQRRVGGTMMGKPDDSAADFRFSRLLARQSPTLVVVARGR